MKKLLFILCIAWLSLYTAHAQSSNNYRPSTNVKFEKSTLPLVFITVNKQVIQKESKILGSMKVVNNADGVNYTDLTAHPNQKIEWEGPITIKYRGNTSFTASNKKPFAIRPLQEANLESKKEKVALLGMGKDNDWTLLAPWQDKSYMRDVLTMELARGGHTFAPHMEYCEVFVDGWYYGIYILSERATKGKYRLNLDDPKADDLTGDFHVEIDRDDELPNNYYTSKHHPVKADGTVLRDKKITYQYKEPEYDDFKELPDGVEQAIQREIDKMEDAFAAADYTNPETGYRQYIDVASFIDLEIAQELANNIDGYRLSSPLYKYSDTHAAELGDNAKWKTALWDFNIAYGVATWFNSNGDIWRYNTNDMLYEKKDNQLVPFFWHKLMNDPKYVAELKARWKEQRGKNYSDSYITQKIDELSNILKKSGALERDKQAWGYFGSFDSEVATLKSFIANRLRFMDAGWLEPDPEPEPEPDPIPGELLNGESVSDVVPLKITSGLNYDVIAEAKANPDGYTLSDGRYYSKYARRVDSNSDGGGCNAFFVNPIQSEGALDYEFGKGGYLRNTLDHINYWVAPAKGKNVLLLGANNGEKEAILNLAPAESGNQMPEASVVYLLATSSEGVSEIDVEVYGEGNKFLGKEENIKVEDWYSGRIGDGLFRVAQVGRVKVEGTDLSKLDKADKGESGDGVFYLQRVVVSTNTTEPIRSIKITKRPATDSKDENSNLMIFAVTALQEVVKLDEAEKDLTYLINHRTKQPIADAVKKAVYLKRTFKEGWNPLILPFDMTWDQVEKMFGDGVKLSKATKDSYKGNRVIFYPVAASAEKAIEGGGYYLIKDVTLHTEDNLYSCERLRYTNPVGYPENKIGFAAPFTAANDKNSGYTTTFKGVYVAEKPIDPSSYAMSGGKFYYYEDQPVMKGFRFWFTVVDELGNAKKMEWAVEDDGVTAIENIDTDAAPADTRVYSIDGRLVSDKGLTGLAKGLYIMNNKKVMVK